jgi:hypothetical protein
MKALPKLALLAASMLYVFTSCGGGEQKDKTVADTTTVAPPPVSVKTIVTTPENMMIVRHKVKNYEAWLPFFEDHDTVRVKYGLHKYVIGRGWPDTNMILVAMKFDDAEKVKAFGKDPSLKTAMQKGGVISEPIMQMTVTNWQDTANVGTVPRVLTEFTVKDWNNWYNKFTEGRKERVDNGITDRVVGHDIMDDHKVELVTALTDTARAFAYWKSDALKKRREESGMIGEPKRFMFTIVKKY